MAELPDLPVGRGAGIVGRPLRLPLGNAMFDWPAQKKTSPTSTSLAVLVSSFEVAVRVYGPPAASRAVWRSSARRTRRAPERSRCRAAR